MADRHIHRYGLPFDPDFYDDAEIERFMLQQGGQFDYIVDSVGFHPLGKPYGNGLLWHFKRYWSLLWPEDSQNEWTDLILENVLKHKFTSLVGPASAWKSGTVSRLALMDWSLFPECTSVLMSSTDMEGLRSRIYGECTMMWKHAHERYDWFPGFPVDSKCVITDTNVDEESARDIRNSLVGIPCKTSTGTFIGMGKYSGRKNRRVWCLSDEFQFMQLSVLQAQDNLVSNDDGTGGLGGYYPEEYQDPAERGRPRRHYRCVFIGNTNPSVRDNPLDLVSEPEKGWGSVFEPTETVGKTQVWKCKQHPKHPVQCYCINLDGLDSPNSKFPIDKPRWAHMAGPHKIKTYTPGSESYWSNGRGVFKFGLDAFKIITRELCEQFHAMDPPSSVAWDGETTKIGMNDASYGSVGGDRCALGWLEFGKCVDGKVRMVVHPHWLIPVTIRKDMMPEDQIAAYAKDKMESVGVLPENFFFDGRGSLAISYARIWSPKVNSIEFGGIPSDRPAGPDIYTTDKITGNRRLKTAREHYSKFVTELWWSTHYIIQSDQMRGLTLEVVLDGQPREWYKVANDKIEIETKADLKKRTGVSPDLFDMVVTGVEGARRRGFTISNVAPKEDKPSSTPEWLQEMYDETREAITANQLQES